MIFFPLMVAFLAGDAIIITYFSPSPHWMVWLVFLSAAGLAWIVFEAWRISR